MDGTANYGWLIQSSSEGGGYGQKLNTAAGSLTFNFTCKAGYVESPANYCSACTSTAKSNCADSQAGNSCNDPGPPSAYSCSCGNNAYTSNGSQSCVTKCSANTPCDNAGDTGSSCTPNAGATNGYTCTCSTGFNFNGSTCVNGCSGSSNPCGVIGSSCTAGGGGTWTCSCPTGYTSSGGGQPSCVDLNECDATAKAACIESASGNACVDVAAPGTGYTCTCANAAYTTGTNGLGKAICKDKNECAVNHCTEGGDSTGTCEDHVAPAAGYTCHCKEPYWTEGTMASTVTCVDRDECASVSNPCAAGTCTNLGGGGGYKCACDAGYVLDGPAKSPICVNPDGCNAQARSACGVIAAGNTCNDTAPPAVGYTCTCNNPAYKLGANAQSCQNVNECAPNHCITGGDKNAKCVDHPAPKLGFDCQCSDGFAFDGKTCVDVNECEGQNPCGSHGQCGNTKGSYVCQCGGGFAATKDAHPKCVSDGQGRIVVKTENGFGCGVGDATPTNSALSGLLLLLAVALTRFLAQRSASVRR